MSGRNSVNLALATGVFLSLWVAAVRLAPSASASPLSQLTPAAATPQVTLTPVASRTPAPGEQTYTVEAGDTLWSIAARFYGNGARYTVIMRANNLAENSRLRIGTVLIIPPLADVEPGPSPTSSLVPTATLVPTAVPSPTPPGATLTVSSQELPLPPADSDVPTPKSSNPSIAPLVPYIQLALYTVSAICFLGSLFCGYLSLEVYRRSRHFAKRRYIRGRVRVSR